MPLASLDGKRIPFPKDGDWYELKTQLSFYDEQVENLGTVISLAEFKDEARAGDFADSEMAVAQRIMDRMPMVELSTKKKLSKLKAWLLDWSHPDPLTVANIRRIPPHQAEVLLKEIEALFEASAPFRGETEPAKSD